MLSVTRFGGLSLIVLTARIAAAQATPGEALAALKKEAAASVEELRQKAGAPVEEQNEAYGRYRMQMAALAHRALALAEMDPDSPEAPEALAWIISHHSSNYGTGAARDRAYDLLSERHLENDLLLPVIGSAWADAQDTAHAEPFLRAALAQSSNLRIKAAACFSLGRHQHYVASIRQAFDAPFRGKQVEGRFTPGTVKRVRALNLGELRREAEALYERTLKEFADLRPHGQDGPSLGEKAEGGLFKLRNLEIGCALPEIDGADIDGKPMKLSEFRGKVVVLSFWAAWCGPCMGLVPDEKELVDRMKGRPFAFIGVNGDGDRATAKAVAAREGINWRSFWDGGSQAGISLRWGVSRWPSTYLIDAQGIIRDVDLVREELDRSALELVAATEAVTKRP
jgi:thiol-disulfide isomerase/thioredoxin